MEFKEPFPAVVAPPIPPHSTDTSTAVQTTVLGVSIFHPGYPQGYFPLLYFPALDDDGIDYNLAYLACCILVGNTWPRNGNDGNCPYLAETSDPGARRITCPPDSVLRKSSYYLFVPACPEAQYPITPNFSNWVFPHDGLPEIWSNIEILPVPWYKAQTLPRASADAIATRDECCRITQAFCGNQYAHIIPRSVKNWYPMNDMAQYSYDPSTRVPLDDLANGLLLRSDVHHMLDQTELLIFPKYTGDKYELVLHILHSRPRYLFEQRALYHNRKLHTLYGVSREFLFARFAWSIFQDDTFRIFQTQRSPFKLLIRDLSAPGTDPKIITKHAGSASQVMELSPSFAEVGSRKRSRGEVNEEGCRWVYSVRKERMVCLTDEEEEEEEEEDDDTDTDEEEESRPFKFARPNSLDAYVPPLLSSSNSSSNDSNASNEHLDKSLLTEIPKPYYNASTKRFFPLQYRR
ncbi:uncharacterized protein GGS22DRAFT_138037 [Annulohypoxylon maeteangense]|uniref:uncharacterized protein n=1 Tax=Annulohypoxylon maeteangense TaxID=1927788 RepID=UPI0020084ACC|nr:uncharacterized protein GGS22DRAFT_138037 [Annulohypoxylon maeteangense]KAI0885056.1 hypothetical protein GGS22DRAFT_138037 [Annulohypoxylon maeteangense]